MIRKPIHLITLLLFIVSCEEKKDDDIIPLGSLIVAGNHSAELTFLKVSNVLGNDHIEASNRAILKFSEQLPIFNFGIYTPIDGNTFASLAYRGSQGGGASYIMQNPEYIYQKDTKIFQIDKTILYREINRNTHTVDSSTFVSIYGSLEVNQ